MALRRGGSDSASRCSNGLNSPSRLHRNLRRWLTTGIIKAKGSVEKDLSYNPKEMLALVFPPPDNHGGFTEPKRTGTGKARSDVHRDGDWHHSVHIWLLDSKQGKVLVQRRSMNKDTNPGKLDVSAAGHIEVGDDSLDTALREIEEELGLHVLTKDLDLIFTAVSDAKGFTEKHGEFICRELQDVYVIDYAKLNSPEEQKIVVADGEVDEAMWIDIDQLKQDLESANEDYVFRERTYIDGLIGVMTSKS